MTFHPSLDAAVQSAAGSPDPLTAALVLGGAILASAIFATLATRHLFP